MKMLTLEKTYLRIHQTNLFPLVNKNIYRDYLFGIIHCTFVFLIYLFIKHDIYSISLAYLYFVYILITFNVHTIELSPQIVIR